MRSSFSSNSKCPSQCTCSKYFKAITCSNKNLKEIPANIPKEVTELFLGNNKISKIKKDDLKGLYNLSEISFIQNNINEIEIGAFNDQQNLRIMTFRNNLLTKIDSTAFKGLSSLQKLYLTNNYLMLPPSLENIPQLTYLTLDNNKLYSADICKGINFSNFSKLTTIIFSNNPNLTSIQFKDLSCLSVIKKLDFSRCDLKFVDNNAFKLPQLNSIVFSLNQNLKIDILQKIFLSFENISLTSLNVNDVFNKVDELNNLSLFSTLKKLKNLFMCNIKEIITIKQGIFSSLKSLEILDLKGGSMQHIEENFTLNKNLKTLKLNNCNKLEPLSIKNFASDSLEELYLDNIPLKFLDSDIFIKLTNLKVLSLKSCDLTTIQVNTFQQLTSLTNLDLSYNSLGGTNLPGKIFESLSSLVSLDLSYNKMTTINTHCNLFNGLISLNKLSMAGNDCVDLCVDIFKTIDNLEILDLSENLLGQMKDYLMSNLLMPLSNLAELNLKKKKVPTATLR